MGDGMRLNSDARNGSKGLSRAPVQEMVLDPKRFQVGNQRARVEGRCAGIDGCGGESPHLVRGASALELPQAMKQGQGVLAPAETDEESITCATDGQP